jgi:UDP-N-acetyl-D-glucosamine dehydrogenase
MTSHASSLPTAAQGLLERFANRQAEVGVIGLGYVGLPLAVVFAEAGFNVVGVDLASDKVDQLKQGRSPIEDIPDERIRPLVDTGRLKVDEGYQALSAVDSVSICVPTPLRKTGDPDLSFIVSAVKALRPVLHREMVIVLESTTYPGTTREVVLPELEEGGLKVGEDIFLAFSPERVDPGRTDWTTENTPKVIGGITQACTEVAASLYGEAVNTVVRVSSAEVAEMTKLLENTFRAVNIGLVNEMALMCERLQINVWEVIEAASSKPFGFMQFKPGPGLGGHCIPIDPLYLSWKLKSLKYNARFIELASEINTNMPRYVVGRIQDALNDQGRSLHGAKVLVLGVSYKPNVADTRESPALDIIGLLREKGAEVTYHDPYVPALADDAWALTSVPDLMAAVRESDCVVIVADHDVTDYTEVVEQAKLVFDTRNATGAAGIHRANVVVL